MFRTAGRGARSTVDEGLRSSRQHYTGEKWSADLSVNPPSCSVLMTTFGPRALSLPGGASDAGSNADAAGRRLRGRSCNRAMGPLPPSIAAPFDLGDFGGATAPFGLRSSFAYRSMRKPVLACFHFRN